MSEYLMYLRKSRQDDPNENVEEVLSKHEIQLQEYALRNFKYHIPEEDIYREVVSGETIDDRPMINELFKSIESGDIKGVLVIEPQRLTRGDMLDCGTVEHLFRYTNTLVVTPPKTYDLSDKYDRKLFEMELSRGSDFLDYTKEILERGRKASTRRGNYVHSIPPYGYDKVRINKDWTLVPNETESQYVKLAFKLFNDGLGCNGVAHKLDALGARTRNGKPFESCVVSQMLQNPVYIGKLKIGNRSTVKVVENGKLIKKRIRNKNYDVVDGKHEALIDADTFEKAQERFGSNTKENTSHELKNMYAGLMKCGICGKAIMIVPYSNTCKRVDRYKCRNSFNCGNISHRFDEINDAIVEGLKKHLHDFEVKYMEDTPADNEAKQTLLNSLKKNFEEIDKKMNSICEYLESGLYTADMFLSRKKALEEEKERLIVAIENTKKEMHSECDLEEKIITLHKALDMLNDDSISAKTKNRFLKTFIKVIYYKKTKEDGISLDIILL
uniref:Integrase n=1 Tax=Siphoviridae sp. ctulf7 TaxID=2826505 RepID=A0A8S5M5P5_9CAUD|nr:MAG TPA: integrase [Siphoviridae sp. ctulf7]